MNQLSPLGYVVGIGVGGISLGLLAYIIARVFGFGEPSQVIIIPVAIISWVFAGFIYWREEIKDKNKDTK